jgi:hypothetical protein
MPEATDVPREASPANGHGPTEDEPLLGRPGAVLQKEQDNLLANLTSGMHRAKHERPPDLLLSNLILGTAAIAQIGIFIVSL